MFDTLKAKINKSAHTQTDISDTSAVEYLLIAGLIAAVLITSLSHQSAEHPALITLCNALGGSCS